jgi:hypothetical protein
VHVTEGIKRAVYIAVGLAVLLLSVTADARRQRPELVVKSLDGLPATAATGSEFEVRDKVRNKGRKADRTRNRYFLSKNKVRDPADIKLEGSRKVPRLKRGESSTGTVQLGVPGGTTRGAYRLLACADASRKVRERRESNNCTASEDWIEVTGGGPGDNSAPPSPQITATDPLPPSSDRSPTVFGIAERETRVRIYAGDCSGQPLDGGSAAAFNGPGGINVRVPEDRVTHLRATATDDAGNVSGCSADFRYEEDSTPPAAPALGTIPASPSANETPLVLGGAEAGSTVRVFAGGCAGAPLATGTAGTAAAFAISVTVAANATTTLHANATDPAGNTSGCSAGVDYVEDSTAPADPAIGTSPASPAEGTPQVLGTAEAGSTVAIYADSASPCAGTPFATVTATAFAAGVTPPTVADGSTTVYSASATDAAGNVSGCSAVTYEELAP